MPVLTSFIQGAAQKCSNQMLTVDVAATNGLKRGSPCSEVKDAGVVQGGFVLFLLRFSVHATNTAGPAVWCVDALFRSGAVC